MQRYDTILLVADSPAARGVHDEHDQQTRAVLCCIKSVGRREAYEAMGHGKHPEYVFELSHGFEYQGEKRAIYNGVTYDIMRSYETEADAVELIAERVAGL